MLPGIVRSPLGLPEVQKGSLCAVTLVGNRYTVYYVEWGIIDHFIYHLYILFILGNLVILFNMLLALSFLNFTIKNNCKHTVGIDKQNGHRVILKRNEVTTKRG